MAVIYIESVKKEHCGFFDAETLAYLLPEIEAISEMQAVPSDFTKTRRCYVFFVYLTHGVNFEIGFGTWAECQDLRRDLINKLIDFHGSEQVLMVKGYECEVVLISAISDVTEIFNKDRSTFFSVIVGSMPYPVNLIYSDDQIAKRSYATLLAAIENDRRRSCIEQTGLAYSI